MGVEDQKEEREVLESIFPDEITDVSDTAYRISIQLELPTSDVSDVSPPTILLNVSYPEAYPDVAPHLDITSPPNAPKYTHLDVAEDKTALLDALQTTIEDSLGMSMVFSLVTALKETAETLIADRLRQVQELKEVEKKEAEEKENRKFHGTVVTKERFLEWREKFRKEMADAERVRKEEEEAEDKKRRGNKVEEKKMTGRMLWQMGLAGKVEEEDGAGEGGAGVAADIGKLKVGV